MAARRQQLYTCSRCNKIFISLEALVRHQCAASVQECAKGVTMKDCETVTIQDFTNRKTRTECSKCATLFIPSEGHNCTGSPLLAGSVETDPGPSSGGGNSEGEVQQSSWTRGSTLFFIGKYKMFADKIRSGQMKRIVPWRLLSEEMKKNGFNFSADQVQGKWKTLMRSYKAVKDHNNKSGNSPKIYEFESQLDEIVGDDPSVTPKYTSSSLKQPIDTGENRSDASEEGIGTSEEATKPRKKQKQSSSAEVVFMLKSLVEENERRQKEEAERRERMHNERMQILQSLVKAIESKK